jgi:glycolate oxidase FAD binding subunit
MPTVGAPPIIPHQRLSSGFSGLGTVTTLLEGSAAGVAARSQALIELLGTEAVTCDKPPNWWGAYPFDSHQIAVKIAAPPAELHIAMRGLHDAAGSVAGWRGSAGVGVCYAALPATADQAEVIEAVRRTLNARGGSCVVLNAPAVVRDSLDMWGPISGLALMKAVKDRFDPDRRLAPGRFVGGI